jgi:hypothetical protein
LFRHADYGSATYLGGVVCGLFGVILAALTVNEIRRARNSMRKTTALGRVVAAGTNKTNYYGDVVGKIIDVAFTTANGTRITFSEDVNDTYSVQQEVTVHYDPLRPRDTATVFAPRSAVLRLTGYTAATLFFLAIFVSAQFFGG